MTDTPNGESRAPEGHLGVLLAADSDAERQRFDDLGRIIADGKIEDLTDEARRWFVYRATQSESSLRYMRRTLAQSLDETRPRR